MDDNLKQIVMELMAKIERIDERTELMLKRMEGYNGAIGRHSKKFDDLERQVEKHSTYFKIIGGAITFLVMIICAIISVIDKLYKFLR